MLNRLVRKQRFKLAYVITGEQLFLEMPHAVIVREVFRLSRGPVSLKIVCIHNGVHGQEREQQCAAGLCHADRFVDRFLHVLRGIEVVHRSEHQRQIESVVREPGKIQRVALIRMQVFKTLRPLPKHGKVAVDQLHGGNEHALLCKRGGIPSGPRAELQHVCAFLCKAVDIVHGHKVLELSAPAPQ